jgi:hypothetical protein
MASHTVNESIANELIVLRERIMLVLPERIMPKRLVGLNHAKEVGWSVRGGSFVRFLDW